MADQRPTVLVFRELTEDDKQKLEAEPRYATTGGGARDFRFNYDAFKGVFGRMFLGREEGENGRIFVGKLTEPIDTDEPNGDTETREVKFWPPTPSRQSEGRVTRVHQYESFKSYPRDHEGRIYLLILQTCSDEVRAHYVTEDDLRTDAAWHPCLRETILNCATSCASSNNAVTGWIDFTRGKAYCHD